MHRSGDRVTSKIGDIILEPGDTLLLQTRSEFVTANRDNREFYLVSNVGAATPIRADKMPTAAFIAMGLIAWLIATSFLPRESLGGLASPAIASLSVAILLVLTRCVKLSDARAAVDIQILLTIAAALGLGKALDVSGLARISAESLVASVGDHPFLHLLILYIMTVIFTEMISNNAVAALLTPIAIGVGVLTTAVAGALRRLQPRLGM